MKPFVLPFLILLLLLLALSIPGHPLHIDEAWIGEQTYFLARDGYVHSNLFEGLAGHETRSIVYHRLFVTVGSWMVGLFGWGIGALRAVPVTATLALLVMLALYMRRERGADRWTMLLPPIILLLIPIIFYHAKIYRPETMMALLGFGSYWMLERVVSREAIDRRRAWEPVAAGLLAGLAALSHLYGLVFIVAGAYLLARARRPAAIAIFLVAAALPFIPYLIDIASHEELFREQITNPIAARKTSFMIITPFLNLLEEHKRLFRKPEIILVVLLFILAAVAAWRSSGRRRRLFLEYTIALIILTGMVAGDKLVTRYAIPLFPFFAVAIASAIIERPGMLGNSRIYRAAFASLLVLFTGYGLWFQAGDTFGARQDAARLNGEIGAMIPDGARVVAPMNMIFNQIERLHIAGLYLAAKEGDGKLSVDRAIDFAIQHNARFIVTNRLMTDEEEIENLDSAVIEGKGFVVMKKTGDYVVLGTGWKSDRMEIGSDGNRIGWKSDRMEIGSDGAVN